MLSERSQSKKSNTAYFCSYVESRSKMMVMNRVGLSGRDQQWGGGTKRVEDSIMKPTKH
jgi:hypothetical protein